MKIIVMSDSHGDVETVKAISALSADALFHCGDSELSFNDPNLKLMHKVRGNCDNDVTFPSSAIAEIGEKKILAVHGHEHDVKNSLMRLYYIAKENNADIVLFGHSHLYGAEMKDGILFVNPGSTVLPRGGKPCTYAVIEWGDDIRVSFKNLAHQEVEQIVLNKF